MKSTKKIFTVALAAFLTIFSATGIFLPRAAQAQPTIPQVEFVSAPVTEYTVGDRVQFKIFAPNYTGRVEYRVVLWNDSTKSYGDLWHAGNGYPARYYTKWQPKGNDVFTLGWPIYEPGSYRITVYVKRVGIAPAKAYLKGYNCDSYMESVAFTVKPLGPAVASILPPKDIVVNQGGIPILPATVKAVMEDGTQRELKVKWNPLDTSRMGIFTLEGTVEGTTKKASIRVTVNQSILIPSSVTAISNSSINVVLPESINFAPALSRFKIVSPNATTINIFSAIMAKDQKSFQLVTDYMTSGYWYYLVIDDKEYAFSVPYFDGRPPAYGTVAIKAYDRTVILGDYIYPSLEVSPSNASLRYSSSNPGIASVDELTGKIRGLSIGTATIYVTGSREGYYNGWTTFRVNVVNKIGTVSAPIASPTSGEIPYGTSIYLSTSTQGADIYYTLDGTIPTIASYKYSAPIVIKSNSVLRAFAVKPGLTNSEVATFTYTLRSTGISTNVWLRDRTYSDTNYYYIDWRGPYELILDKSAGGRRIIKLLNLKAKSILTGTEKYYGDVVFNETGVGSGYFTTSTWDGIFSLSMYSDVYEYSIRLKNNSSVELRMLNPLMDYPDYIRDWFK